MNAVYNKNVTDIDINEIIALMRFRGGSADEMMETERLVLLPSSNARDLETYHEHLTTEGDFYYQYGFDMTDDILPKCDFESNGVVCYTLFLKATGEMTGYVGLGDRGEGTANLEFHIFKDHRNKGYCKEAAARYLEAYFNGELSTISGDRVVAETFFENEASKAVLLSLGFKSEGIGFRLPSDENENGKICETLVSYVLERKENEKAA